MTNSERQAHSLRSPSSRSSYQFNPALKDLTNRFSTGMDQSLIPSPPQSPQNFNLRKKHLSTGSLGKYFRNSSSVSLLRPSNTSNHSNLETEIPDYVVINDVKRVSITKCMAREVIYSNGKVAVIAQPKPVR